MSCPVGNPNRLSEQTKLPQAQFVPQTPHYCVISSSKTQTKSLRRRFQVLELVTPMTNCYRFSARPTNRRQYPVTTDSVQNSESVVSIKILQPKTAKNCQNLPKPAKTCPYLSISKQTCYSSGKLLPFLS